MFDSLRACLGIGPSATMTDDTYRPTDYLAVCRMSYGIGSYETSAVFNALRYAGPFEDEEEPVSVAVWELYADSWQSHGVSGPERSAEQLSFTEYKIPPELADEAAGLASDAHHAVDRAINKAEVTQKIENDDDEGDDES